MKKIPRSSMNANVSCSPATDRKGVSLATRWLTGPTAIVFGLLSACSSGKGSGVSTPPDAAAQDDGGSETGSDDGQAAEESGQSVQDAGPATITISGGAPLSASATSYGQNYWCWAPSYGDQVSQAQAGASAMKLNVLRAGGHNNDTNSPDPFTNDQIDTFVAYARAIGAEPILQVPILADTSGNQPTAQTAADMVTYANVTKGYGIKYWTIGNEPDLYSDQGDRPGYTVDNYCTDFGTFGDAMRAVDPTIQILGPELSWKYIAGNDWLTPFLTSCGSKVDIVSLHRYPETAAASNIVNAMVDGPAFGAVLTSVRALMTAADAGAKPLAVTEANFSYDGDPADQTGTATMGTFYAGMWVADALGVALDANLWTMAFWSLDETYDFGFFTSDTFAPKPAAYAYELISTHFGPTLLKATATSAAIAAHASRDDAAGKTIVLLMNRTANATSQVLGFTGLAVNLPNRAITLPGYSLMLLELPDDGSAPTTWLYTKAMSDADGGGPQQQ
jgi:hypothetical protein